MKGKRRHDFFYRLGWALFRRYIAGKFNFEYDNIKVGKPLFSAAAAAQSNRTAPRSGAVKPPFSAAAAAQSNRTAPRSGDVKPPYIVVANHITNWDPILIGLSFGRNMYYVATDQIFRMGFKTKLLMFFFSPIARAKTARETQTVIAIFKRLKDNCNICIFAEGSTSYDGQTCEIQPTIGKLVKRAGVTLVTYRFTGSYFTFPRWARFIRKGKMEGRLAQIYSPEKIASMTETEIYEAVKNDIYVDAYSDQEKNPVAFHGKKPAEYLETILYCCPKCRQFSTLKSQDDILFCTCGFKVRYDEFGYFQTPDNSQTLPPPYKTITDWVNWQRKEIAAIAASIDNLDSNTAIFADENQKLIQIEKTYTSVFIAEGKLCLYKDRLSLTPESGPTIEFPIKAIIDMSGFAMMTVIFSTNENKIFEIHSEYPRSALKYLDMYKSMNTVNKE